MILVILLEAFNNQIRFEKATKQCNILTVQKGTYVVEVLDFYWIASHFVEVKWCGAVWAENLDLKLGISKCCKVIVRTQLTSPADTRH